MMANEKLPRMGMDEYHSKFVGKSHKKSDNGPTNEKIPFMVDKSVFIQFAPIAVSFVIAIICEAYFADDDND